jgi:hypothetical protein
VQAQHIVVDNIRAGSVVVEWHVLVPPTVASTASSLVQQLREDGGTIEVTTASGLSFNGDPSSIANPTVEGEEETQAAAGGVSLEESPSPSPSTPEGNSGGDDDTTIQPDLAIIGAIAGGSVAFVLIVLLVMWRCELCCCARKGETKDTSADTAAAAAADGAGAGDQILDEEQPRPDEQHPLVYQPAAVAAPAAVPSAPPPEAVTDAIPRTIPEDVPPTMAARHYVSSDVPPREIGQPPMIQLWIKMPSGRTESLTVEHGTATRVLDVRAQLAARIAQTGADVDVSVCRLIFAGRELEDDLTLADYNCEEASELNLILRVSQADTEEAEEDSSIDMDMAQRETESLRALLARKKLRDFRDFVKVGGKDIATASLGRGGYSHNGVCSYVYKATLREGTAGGGGGREVALKVMLNYEEVTTTLALGAQFQDETTLLSDPVRLPAHRHIIAVLHSFADTADGLPGWDFDPSIVRARTTIVVMPFLPKDLKVLMKSVHRRGERFSDLRAARIVHQLLLAICHLKAHEIVHRDVKLDNVLLADVGTERERAVLTDFGMHFDLRKNGVVDSRVELRYDGFHRGGAPIALAPEVTLPQPGPGVYIDYSKNDEWAVGMIAHELFSPLGGDAAAAGCTPFDDMAHPASYADEGYREEGISQSCRPLVRGLLRVDAERRLDAVEGSRQAKRLVVASER